ncbi:hypothetical protein JCM3774_006326 [Rhodotorula dairenensis]
MEHPATDIARVLRELTQADARAVDRAVDKYFTNDAQLIVPLFTTPKRVGKEAVKAAYRLRHGKSSPLRRPVLTYNTEVEVRCAGFDRAKIERGVEHMTGLVDCVQSVQGRLMPLPTSLNPVAHIRILIRFDCIKCPDDLYRIYFQEVNIPSDWASTGLHVFPFDAQIVNGLKWMGGLAALVVGGTLVKVLG